MVRIKVQMGKDRSHLVGSYIDPASIIVVSFFTVLYSYSYSCQINHARAISVSATESSLPLLDKM
jgi:hypothetical protein